MIITARFGATQSNLGYQFFGSTGSLIGARVTAGISALPETGSYIADATVPTGAKGVFWNDTVTLAQASEELRDALAIAALPAAVRTELSTELARVDVAVSTRNATEPDNAGIAIIQAALSDADQIFLASPFVPDDAPVLIIPAPNPDESLTVVYIYTESITNAKRAGIELTFRLVSTPAKSERVLEIAPKTMLTDSDGFAEIPLQRDHEYRVTCAELGLNKTFTPQTETFDLLTLIL